MHCTTNKDDLAFISVLKLSSLINTRDIKEIQDPSIFMQSQNFRKIPIYFDI